jgi:hypothetical protein
MKHKSALIAAALLLAAVAARLAVADPATPVPAAMQGDPARPESAHWIRSELYFAIGPVDAPEYDIREIRWRAFLDREVTPRFPDGLTVLDAYGQWRSRGVDAPSRLRSKVLVILCEDTPANRMAIDAIRVAYKTATNDKSVLLVTEHVDVSF